MIGALALRHRSRDDPAEQRHFGPDNWGSRERVSSRTEAGQDRSEYAL